MKTWKTLLALALLLTLTCSCLPFALAEGKDTSAYLTDEPIEYTLMVRDVAAFPWLQDSEENGSVITNTIFEKTNVRLKLQIVANSDFSTKVDLLLGTNQMPDIIKVQDNCSDIVSTYAPSGVLLDLTDYLPQYAPHYSALREGDDNIKMYDYNGQVFSFVQVTNKSEWPIFGPAWNLRTDWLEETGLPAPTTLDDLLEVLVAIKKNHPESDIWTCRKGTTNLLERAAYSMGSGYNIYFEPETNRWEFAQINDSFKYVLGFLAKAYAQGVLDPDYAVMNSTLWKEKMSTGEAALSIDNPGFNSEFTYALQETNPNACVEVIRVPVNGYTNTARSARYDAPENAGFLVSADIEHPEVAVALLDWLYSPEGIAVTNYGREGETFYYDENGQPQFLEAWVNDNLEGKEGDYLGALQVLVGGGQLKMAGCWDNENAKASARRAAQIEMPASEKSMYTMFTQDPAYHAGYIKPQLTVEDNETVADILSAVDTYLAGQYDRFIMGEVGIDAWDEVIAKVKSMGIDRVVEIYNSTYDRLLGR